MGKLTMRMNMSVCFICVAAVTLSGCMSGNGNGQNVAEAGAVTPALAQIQPKELNGNGSQIIRKLLDRRTIIPTGSSFDTVAKSVLASNARIADSDLRAARLRSQAKSMNWLPSIGPVVSLTSLGSIVAQLVVEQVVFDNGRKKAERQFAAHDVEVAAVTLSRDSNDRVATALQLYIQSQQAQEEALVAQRGRKRMGELVHIIDRRVNGGVSNMAELSVGRSKLNELQAEYSRAREVELTARAELEAMTRVPIGDLQGLTHITPNTNGTYPLNVLQAQAEGRRGVAQARMDRADLLPGLSIGGTVGKDGTNIGAEISGDRLLNLGTGAALKAIQASEEAARRTVQQAEEDNQRIVRRLEQKRIALQRQQSESAALVADAQKTYRLFFNQFQNSGRPIMDVVNMYENAMRLERDAVRLKYELAQIEVQIASLYGILVSGGDV